LAAELTVSKILLHCGKICLVLETEDSKPGRNLKIFPSRMPNDKRFSFRELLSVVALLVGGAGIGVGGNSYVSGSTQPNMVPAGLVAEMETVRKDLADHKADDRGIQKAMGEVLATLVGFDKRLERIERQLDRDRESRASRAAEDLKRP
jgi:hypothetical protein